MLEYVILAAFGCLLGVATGLTPGLHVNTVSMLGLSVYAFLGLNPLEFAVVAVAMSVTHSFLDFIPGIFLGIPEEDTALSILPAHRLVLEGRALEAVKLTGYGCLLGLVFAVLLLPLVVWLVPLVYQPLRKYVVYVISAAAFALMFRESGIAGKIWALSIFLLSGALGLLTLNMKTVSATYLLFPVFSGMFGLSGILYSLKDRERAIPQKEYARVRVDGEVVGGGFAGALGGAVIGVLPAMSPSQIGIIMSSIFRGSQRRFLVSVAAINTSDAVYSLVSLYTIRNARSGVSVMISRVLEMSYTDLLLLTGIFLLSAFAATYLHIAIGRKAMTYYRLVDYRLVSTVVMAFIIAMVYALVGWFGLLVAVVSTSIGLLPILSGVSRTHLMGVLMVPTILYFVGGGWGI